MREVSYKEDGRFEIILKSNEGEGFDDCIHLYEFEEAFINLIFALGYSSNELREKLESIQNR